MIVYFLRRNTQISACEVLTRAGLCLLGDNLRKGNLFANMKVNSAVTVFLEIACLYTIIQLWVVIFWNSNLKKKGGLLMQQRKMEQWGDSLTILAYYRTLSQ